MCWNTVNTEDYNLDLSAKFSGKCEHRTAWTDFNVN